MISGVMEGPNMNTSRIIYPGVNFKVETKYATEAPKSTVTQEELKKREEELNNKFKTKELPPIEAIEKAMADVSEKTVTIPVEDIEQMKEVADIDNAIRKETKEFGTKPSDDLGSTRDINEEIRRGLMAIGVMDSDMSDTKGIYAISDDFLEKKPPRCGSAS